MTYKKLTNSERAIRRWRIRRNHELCKLQTENPQISYDEALRTANQKVGRCPKLKKKKMKLPKW